MDKQTNERLKELREALVAQQQAAKELAAKRAAFTRSLRKTKIEEK